MKIVAIVILSLPPYLKCQSAEPDISKLASAAEAGDSASQVSLGRAYQDGRAVEKNDAIAAGWYRKAAATGNSEAQNNLGVMYMNGWGVEKNKAEAIRWYRLAAKQKNAHAMFNLGAAYYNGDGVGIDDVSAYIWFLLAQEAGSTQAEEAVKRSASEVPSPKFTAFVRIAEMYETGSEIPPDQVAVVKWYRKASEAGDLESSISAANLLLFRKNAQAQDYNEGFRLCQNAVKAQFSPGALCLGYIYRHGLGVPADSAQSVTWINRAAELGNTQAMLELSKSYWRGEGVKPDLVAAGMWAYIAVDFKFPGAESLENQLSKEMDVKQYRTARQKALEWEKRHRFFPAPGRFAQR